ncbi:hypothetical protein AB0J74_18535 [Asanoa sp. NPDC049573]|uniref:hypothetical protein n=1 Tax=Asanoa sp. NPDC049573 TaxID=3155396 RepID=UPI003438E0B1
MTAAARLLRLELRNNVMLWLLPLAALLFWFVTFRPGMAYPPMWNLRATAMQTSSLAVFVPLVVGAAAWSGSREGRHGSVELVAGSARSRWARQTGSWAATTCWAIVAYLGCVGVLYAVTAGEGAWGGPLWWPAGVGAASLPAFSALGFTAGALRPSRFTPPVIAIGAFLGLEISANFIQGYGSFWQVSPVVANPWSLGADEGIATFYRYLPDLAIAQILFLSGLTAAQLGLLGLPAGAGGSWLRRSATAVTVAGLLGAGAGVALAGTGHLDEHGMIAIPVLHNGAYDRPAAYTPVCSQSAIPVCVHPAYRRYLPAMVDGFAPVLAEVAGLPGAPVRVNQVAAAYEPGSKNEVRIGRAGAAVSGTPPVFNVVLPTQEAHQMSTEELAAILRAGMARDLVQNLTGGGRGAGDAQQAVTEALAHTSTLPPGSPVAEAARRFAALPAATRRAWLVAHLPALRAGQLTLARLP